LSVLIAYVMLISPAGFEQLANASTQYSELGTSTWGQADRIIEYGQWDGTGRTGNFTLRYDDNGSVVKKITWDNNGTPGTGSDDTKIEEVSYEYNLQNRLARVTTVDYISTTTTVVEYKYNDEGIRVQKTEDPDGEAITTTYLVDSYNHTGYTQTLEENGPAGIKTYTIGDDILTEAVDDGMPKHLLYDGHGSTRQLVSGSVGSMTIQDDFSYDGYGVLLQQESVAQNNPGKVDQQQTNLLYAGEHFDVDSQSYYLRARWYNPLTGLFNRMDPYAGNNSDPQSLHKYLYCHADPTNATDPSGESISSIQIFVATAISKIMFALTVAISWVMSTKVAAILMGLLAIANLWLLFTNPEALDIFIACNGGDLSQMSGIIAMDIWAIRNMLSTFKPAAQNVARLVYRRGSIKDFWKKAKSLKKAASSRSLVWVGDTGGMKKSAKAARAAHRRAVQTRLIEKFRAQGSSLDDATMKAEQLMRDKHVDHLIDLQISGALKNPNAKSNLHMLDSSTNTSIGKQLQLEAQRLGLKAGDTIDDIIIIGPPEP
jgi:RHS repeat-associated protein